MADTYNHRVQVLNSDLGFIRMFGTFGNGKGQFNLPSDVAFDGSGTVYVTDSGNHRIQVFKADGKFLRMFRGHDAGEAFPFDVAVDGRGFVYISERWNHCVSVFTCEGRFVTSFGDVGSGLGQFDSPRGLAVDENGLVYVCDYGNGRLQIF